MKIKVLKTSSSFLTGLLLAAWLCGCAALPGAFAESATPGKQPLQRGQSVQVIIQFKGDVADPSRPDFLADLSRTVAVRVAYVRPMSGSAHVLRLEVGEDAGPIEDLLAKLSQRPDVLFVEQDTVMRHQQTK